MKGGNFMEQRGLTTGAFAALCGTTKETLRHYKDEGLLRPAHQGANGYFYYDVEQFYDYYAIAIFRQTGTPLEEIRRCQQTAGGTLAVLREQRRRLEQERRKLEQMDFVLSHAIGSMEWADPDMVPRVARFEQEHLLAIPARELEGLMEPGAGEDEMVIAVLERCQALCREYGMQPDYQLGAIHLPGVRPGSGTISHLYTRIREPVDCPYCLEKPAGDYLCLCCRGRWDISGGYDALIRYMEEQGVRTSGRVYACDLAGFLLNGVEKNAAALLSVPLDG